MKYPDLSNESLIGIDIETYDPQLKKMGTGVYRKDGKILGVSFATPNGFNEYYNLGHYDCTPEEKQKNLKYIEDVCGTTKPDKVGTALSYDIDWLENFLGIKVNGKLHDIQIAEALIDENQAHYSLDFLTQKYLGLGKVTNEIDQFCIDNDLQGKSVEWLIKMPASLVSKYGKFDSKAPIDILNKQMEILREEDLINLFELENELIRCLLHMRKTGVLIDTEKRDKNALQLQNYIEERRIKLFDEYGEFNYNSSPQIAQQLDKLEIPYAKTDKGNPNIDKYFFQAYEEKHEFVKITHELRKADKVLNTFLLGSLYRYLINGKIHCSFYNTRTDEFGTRSGRFSVANPNLQQIPSLDRDLFLGNLCREIFIPFPDCWWGKIDYSQIEYRFIAHYAIGMGAEQLRQTYNDDPNTDYHQYIMDLTQLDRRKSKNLNFGVGFGMGAALMSKYFGWELDYCEDILKTYHRKAPYIKITMNRVSRTAQRRGYIRTILNRRSRLIDPDKAYIMFARLIQGSAADLMKKAMLDCYQSGVFDILYPHLTVHDELDVSIPKAKQGIEAFKEMKNIMETSIKIKVPIKADAEIGENWANVKEFNAKDLKVA